METTVTGQGTLTFWWKVSSEPGYDFLEFYIDGVLQAGRISGDEDWVLNTFPIGAGSHTLRWRYHKDGSGNRGSDAGWVDQVTMTAGGSPYQVWQAGFFTPEELANAAISSDDVDFDNDGIDNLLEYLFGGNPKLPDSGLLPAVSKAPGSSNVVFTYKRKIASTEVIQVIELSTTLSPPWIPAVHGLGGVTIVIAPVPGDATTEQVTVTIPSTEAKLFVRINASR